MNREILFRGKQVDDGEWAYGWYCKVSFGAWPIRDCIIPSEKAEGGCVEHVEVDPDTVGQWTGLTDRTGKRIFEGDIVKTKEYGKIIPKSIGRGYVNVNDFDVFQIVYEPCMFRLIRKNRGFNLVYDVHSELEVIGNVHDHPEILKGEEK